MHMQHLGIEGIVENKDVGNLTTLRTSAIARWYVDITTRDALVRVSRTMRMENIPCVIVGGGSNIVFTKKFIDKLVVCNRYSSYNVVDEDKDHAYVHVGSGTPIATVIAKTIQAGFEGFEYHLGLPGTIGGALYMNSKWTRPIRYVGDYLSYAHIIDVHGREKKVDRDYFDFKYDYSVLQKTHEPVIDAVFCLPKNDPTVLRKRSREALQYRKETQPFGVATSGCFFQNITEKEQNEHHLPTKSMGYLIDQAGLKGKTVGGFTISKKHANFLVNTGDGTIDDLVALVGHIKKTIQETYGITPREEVLSLS